MPKNDENVLIVNYSGLGNALLCKKSLPRVGDGRRIHMLVEHEYMSDLLWGGAVEAVEVRV